MPSTVQPERPPSPRTIAVILAAAVVCAAAGFSYMQKAASPDPSSGNARCTRVVDADTYDLQLRAEGANSDYIRVRLEDVDAYETTVRADNDTTEAAAGKGREATGVAEDFLACNKLTAGWPVTATFGGDCGFGRRCATLSVDGGGDLGAMLMERCYAGVWVPGGPPDMLAHCPDLNAR